MHHRLFALITVAVCLSCGDDKSGTTDTAPSEEVDAIQDVVFPDVVGTDSDATADVEIVPGGFGAACTANIDCLDGFCVEGPEGFVCTKNCDSECPAGYDCRGVQSGSADTVFLCLPRVDKVCVPCKADYQCTGGACLEIGGLGECATRCEDDQGCPGGYACLADASATREGRFCQPRSGSCDCTPDLAGAVRTCTRENAMGTCYGTETCDPNSGWQGCNAGEPIAEICDGRDNDCNALVDDGLDDNVPCENTTAGIGTCSGIKVCVGTQGYVCTALVPAVETCDFVDNDCNGDTDDVPGRGEACVNESAAGACPGVNVCQDGALVCLGRAPSAERCNYEDDDCDGDTDEGFDGIYQSCSVGRGQCQRFGTVLCNAAGDEAACNVAAGPSGPERCDGLDNDCDGSTDEDFGDVGAVCSDGVGACRGFGTRACKADGSGSECSAVQGAPSDETCDLLDNDCDGATDETFKNAAGKYSDAKACGNCFTDCTVIFAKPHASGTCDASAATPACKLQCAAGYYDLDGVVDNGCEFQLDAAAIYVSESDAGAADDSQCGGGPVATGGNRKPCRSIAYGISRALNAAKTKVLVAGGAYNGNILLRDGISVYGGYNPIDWRHDPESNLTAIFGTSISGHRKTVTAESITQKDTTFDGFAVYGQVANGPAENSYAIWIRNSNGKLHISNNTIWPGTGGPGSAGGRGGNGANGGNGSPGLVARETNTVETYCFKTCTGTNAGGAGGTNAQCGGAAGGAGGAGRCPDYNETLDFCASTASNSAVQTNNTGGGAGSGPGGGAAGVGGCDQQIGQGGTCTCFLPGTIANCPNGQFAGAGGAGQKGTAGARGAAGGSTSGEVAGDEWRGFGGGAGSPGLNGAGGGGGGAGGGVESAAACAGGDDGNDFGGSGGGGGAGGCAGTGGGGGGAGGGAFGIFSVVTLGFGTNLPVIVDNAIHAGFGGVGGRGGDGGIPGLGGQGGLGGSAAPSTDGPTWCAKPGAQGGVGGDGGPGGGGAGGNGGSAYGLFASGGSLADWKNGNTFYTDGAGGAGGAGGGSGAGGNAGADGQPGLVSRHNIP